MSKMHYDKPRIIPRTERHLWPREAIKLDANMGFKEEWLPSYLYGRAGGTPKWIPTADEQDLYTYREWIHEGYK